VAEVFSESWDPRTWLAVAGPVTHEQRPPSLDRPLSGREQWPSRPILLSLPNAMPLALAAAAGVLVLGAVAAHLARPAAVVVAQAAPTAMAAAAAPAPHTVRRTLLLSGASYLAAALVSSGLSKADAEAAAAAARPALATVGETRVALTLGNTGGSAGNSTGGAATLDRLEASNADSSGVVVIPAAHGTFAASPVAAQLTSRVVVRHGTMDADSFYSSAVAAGITDSLIPMFAKSLAFDFDFQREVGSGDAFEAAFDQPVDGGGQPVGPPTLLYAALSTSAKSAAVYRFAPAGGAPEWFDGSGRSIVRALMRTPVDGARVSSTFGMRVHPVLGFMKMHKGTDFAAPIGTPIYAAGNGVIEFAGPKGPNGNFVKLLHDNKWETLYLHMNRFAANIVTGNRVVQGQQLGEIGTTGRSTGPHLHYEVHIDNVPVDSMSIHTEAGRTLSGAALIAFGKQRDRVDVSRAAQAN
jgi:murein DD-endopeptidase MepM/ murein hydrolase activator NlpD